MTAALILQHGEWGPPGLLADWAAARGLPIQVHRIDLGQPYPELNGQAFRIGHLGSLNELEVMATIGGMELAFADMGIDAVKPGSGLLAFQRAFLTFNAGKTLEPALAVAR